MSVTMCQCQHQRPRYRPTAAAVNNQLHNLIVAALAIVAARNGIGGVGLDAILAGAAGLLAMISNGISGASVPRADDQPRPDQPHVGRNDDASHMNGGARPRD